MTDSGFSPDEILHLAKGLHLEPSAAFSRRVMDDVAVAPRPMWTSLGRLSAVYAGLATSVILWVVIFGRPGSTPTPSTQLTAEAPPAPHVRR